eukprot:2275601-Pleurochrysis_carterae.AAC.1
MLPLASLLSSSTLFSLQQLPFSCVSARDFPDTYCVSHGNLASFATGQCISVNVNSAYSHPG